ncbi:hypothetical protein RGR602_PB00184 (plasmid) [Rhizobium gallicum bv. gallicum R602sp]|uniref:Uncharacterized protein n=1 Tax=Rhizobium gallicum bv. gallicum R602sp TaxID=1041138 RepID=A0A0B4XB01_9HYPH|nr:hypothetical protein RGR602_PB00184 [Rhizobium gallicum bv. gallicum R602sp]
MSECLEPELVERDVSADAAPRTAETPVVCDSHNLDDRTIQPLCLTLVIEQEA